MYLRTVRHSVSPLFWTLSNVCTIPSSCDQRGGGKILFRPPGYLKTETEPAQENAQTIDKVQQNNYTNKLNQFIFFQCNKQLFTIIKRQVKLFYLKFLALCKTAKSPLFDVNMMVEQCTDFVLSQSINFLVTYLLILVLLKDQYLYHGVKIRSFNKELILRVCDKFSKISIQSYAFDVADISLMRSVFGPVPSQNMY